MITTAKVSLDSDYITYRSDTMKLLDKICVAIGSIVAILAFITLPYIAVCFIWYNICWCFGIQFSAKVALGILLTIYTLKYIFSKE